MAPIKDMREESLNNLQMNRLALLVLVLPPILEIWIPQLIALPSLLVVILLGLMACCRGSLLTRPAVRGPYFVALVYLVWMMTSSSWSIVTAIAASKMWAIAYTGLLPLASMRLVDHWSSQSRRCFDRGALRFVRFWVRFAAVMFILGLILFGEAFNDVRLIVGELDNPIWVARYAAILIILLGGLSFGVFDGAPAQHGSNALRHFFDVLFLLACVVALMKAGSRGVLAALLLAALISAFFFRVRLSGLGLAVAVASVVLAAGLLTQSYGLSLSAHSLKYRADFFETVLSIPFSNNIWGLGLGSFGYFHTGESVELWPHNIFLESYFEGGLIGLLLCAWFMAAFLLRIMSTREMVFVVLGWFLFLSAQVSGDLRSITPFLALLIFADSYTRTMARSRSALSHIGHTPRRLERTA